ARVEQETALGTQGVLAEVALGSPGRFAAFDDPLTLTVRASDGDERRGPFLPKGGYEDEAQCDSNRSPSPLLKHCPTNISPSTTPDRASFCPSVMMSPSLLGGVCQTQAMQASATVASAPRALSAAGRAGHLEH